jgi:hypothetical protein
MPAAPPGGFAPPLLGAAPRNQARQNRLVVRTLRPLRALIPRVWGVEKS